MSFRKLKFVSRRFKAVLQLLLITFRIESHRNSDPQLNNLLRVELYVGL